MTCINSINLYPENIIVTKDKWYYGVPLSKIKNDTVAFQSYDGNYYDLFADATTLGQCTEQKDKNGTKIFDGDIMQLCNGTYPCLVYWDGKGWAWLMNGKRREIDLTREKMQIIGNIHDNPELLMHKVCR